jgi:hypothetical protein
VSITKYISDIDVEDSVNFKLPDNTVLPLTNKLASGIEFVFLFIER